MNKFGAISGITKCITFPRSMSVTLSLSVSLWSSFNLGFL